MIDWSRKYKFISDFVGCKERTYYSRIPNSLAASPVQQLMVQNKAVIFACSLELKILSDIFWIVTKNSLLSVTARIIFEKGIKIFLNLNLVESNARKQSEGSFGRVDDFVVM